MATSRFPPRSNCSTRTCRDCDGAGEHSIQPYLRPSPYDDVATCSACGGSGRIAFREIDALERVRYCRSYGGSSFFYRQARAEAYRPAPLPRDVQPMAWSVAA